MGKYKEMPKYCVVSVRVTDQEKAYLDALSRRGKTTVTSVMREAMHSYFRQVGRVKGVMANFKGNLPRPLDGRSLGEGCFFLDVRSLCEGRSQKGDAGEHLVSTDAVEPLALDPDMTE